MQCPRCASEQSAENLYCTKCGARLEQFRPPTTIDQTRQTPQSPLSSSKEEEEKILRELKAALKVVDESGSEAEGRKGPMVRPDRLWLALALLLVFIILSATLQWFLKRRQHLVSLPQPSPATEVVAPAPVTPPILDEATRTTLGKMGAIVEALQKYEERKKKLPASLLDINKGYSETESLRDGWGQNLLYLVDIANGTYLLQSSGPDGKRGTADDLIVSSENRETWLKEHEEIVNEWRLASPNLYTQMISVGPNAEELMKLQKARKTEALERARREEALQEEQRKKEAEQRRLEAAREEEEKHKQAEAKKHEEELRQAKLREEAQRQQAMRQASVITENFIGGLTQWDAPSTWEVVKDKDLSALRVQGLGFLKMSPNWDNYKIEFDIKVNKESAAWVVRAQNSSNFYLFKLGSEKAKAIPKNSLVKYIFSDGKYLNSLKREDAPGAADVVLLPFKVRNKDYYHVLVRVKDSHISHIVNGINVDDWSDTSFDRGRFGFNASIIEMATVRNLSLEPLK
jgi:hypothetical protein